MRGFLIQKNSFQKRGREKKKEEILAHLMENDRLLTIKPKDETIKQNRKLLQAQFSMVVYQEVEWRIKMLRQKNFESVNKIGKYLAWQLKTRQKQNVICKIREGKKMIEDPKEIRKVFQKYYKDLYKKEKETGNRRLYTKTPITTDYIKRKNN